MNSDQHTTINQKQHIENGELAACHCRMSCWNLHKCATYSSNAPIQEFPVPPNASEGLQGFQLLTKVTKIIKEENLQLQASKKITARGILPSTISMGTQQSGGVGFLRSHCWWSFGWMVFFIMGVCGDGKNVNWRKPLDRVK